MIQIISKIGDDTTNEVIDWLNFYEATWKRTNFEALLDRKWHITIEDKFVVDFDSYDIADISAIWYRIQVFLILTILRKN